MTFKTKRIAWDTDGDKEVFDSLPQEVEVAIDDPNNIADALSDAYGWCVWGFELYPID